MRLKYWLPTVALVIASASASAQTIAFDGGGNTNTPGPHINTPWNHAGPPPAVAQQFTLSSVTMFDDIRYFWENNIGEAFASVNYSIYTGSAFSPVSTILSGTMTQSFGTNTYVDHAAGGDSYEGFYTDIDVGPVTLGPGTYFLQLHSTDDGFGGTYLPNVYWENATGTSDPAACEQGYPGTSGSCGPDSVDALTDGPVVFDLLRFNQEEPVASPEPASLVLLGTGLIGIAGTVRRQRRTKSCI